jgi:tetratricopeptide (TPR) repeat protein
MRLRSSPLKQKAAFYMLSFALVVLCFCVLASCASVGLGGTYTRGSKDFSDGASGPVTKVLTEYGGYVFGDFTYIETILNYTLGDLDIEGRDYQNQKTSTRFTNIGTGLYWKYPFYFFKDRLTLAPKLGFEYHYQLAENNFEIDAFWLKLGGQVDFSFSKAWYLRGDALYDFNFESFSNLPPVWTFNLGLGYRFSVDPVRKRYKTLKELKAETYLNRAKTAYSNKDYTGAVENYSRLIELEPDNWEYYRARSDAWLGMENYDRALDDFNTSFRMNPMVRDTPKDYDKWKVLVTGYEKAYNLPAPMNNRGIWRLPLASNVRLENTPEFTKKINASGSGSALSLEAGEYEFRLKWSKGIQSVLEPWVYKREIEAGHVYEVRSGETGDDKIRVWIADITNDEIPAILEFTAPDIGEKIDHDRFDCIDRNSGGNGVYTWMPKGFPGNRSRIKLHLFSGDAVTEWNTVTVYTSSGGIVSSREAGYEYRFTNNETNDMTMLNLVRTGLKAAIVSDDRYGAHKDGTYNGLKAEMYIRNDENDSLIFLEEETGDRIKLKVIQQRGIIPGFGEN